jgi:hypothetical protein
MGPRSFCELEVVTLSLYFVSHIGKIVLFRDTLCSFLGSSAHFPDTSVCQRTQEINQVNLRQKTRNVCGPLQERMQPMLAFYNPVRDALSHPKTLRHTVT